MKEKEKEKKKEKEKVAVFPMWHLLLCFLLGVLATIAGLVAAFYKFVLHDDKETEARRAWRLEFFRKHDEDAHRPLPAAPSGVNFLNKMGELVFLEITRNAEFRAVIKTKVSQDSSGELLFFRFFFFLFSSPARKALQHGSAFSFESHHSDAV